MLDLRGNVNTRLGKLDSGEYDAIVLACAGLKRLGLGDRIRQELGPEIILPAIGQGAIGVECREGDSTTRSLLQELDDPKTAICVAAERAMNTRLMGGCQVPIAGFARVTKGQLTLQGLVGHPDGSEILRGQVDGAPEQAVALGDELADRLLERGADAILRELYEREG